METLSLRRLNRSLLARQLLLGRQRLDPVSAVRRLGGLQAQEPASPYLALHARLDGFRAHDLTTAIHERQLVKATLMRSTLHLVTADDYAHLQRALQAMLRGLRGGPARGGWDDSGLEALADAALGHAASPRTNQELRAFLHFIDPAGGPEGTDPALWRVRRHAAFINAPIDTPWSYGRRPTYVAARAWLAELVDPGEARALDRLARRYLAAFGPATLSDLSDWSGLTVGPLRDAVLRIPGVRQFRTEAGATLYDVPDGPLPDEETPAEVRLLPMWDSTLLAHKDRTRILPAAYRPLVIARNGDVAPTYLVNGLVAGLWWTESGSTNNGVHVVLEPFEPLARLNRTALEAEAERLLAFVKPYEPRVFGRFRGSSARRRWVRT